MRDSGSRHRVSHRLGTHAYVGPAWYFVTLNAEDRRPLFGALHHGGVRLSRSGEVVQEEWVRIPLMRPGTVLDAFVVMPDHFHGLIWLPGGSTPPPRVGLGRAKGTLGSVIAGFKAAVCSRIRSERSAVVWKVWQRDYHDRILRTEAALSRVRRYILDNPRKAR